MCACTNGNTRSCADDGKLGLCAGGIETCAMGAWGSCTQLPATEVCNAIDDDCDGMVDEGDPGGGLACNISYNFV